MKKLLTLVLCLFALNSVFGQSTVNYAFSTATGTTLADMSSGTTQLVAGPNDDAASSLTNIGFPFFFMGAPYSQFSVNSNGQMRLGSTIIAGGSVSSAAVSAPFIVPISGDNYTLSTGKVHYKVTGTSPNQILVVEWKDLRIPYGSTGVGSMVQAWLYEGTGKIEFRYGSVSNNASPSTARATFISSSNTTNTVKYIGADMISAVDGSSVSTYTMTDPNTALLNTRIYTFTPAAIIPANPTTLTFTAVTTTTITPNWVDNSTDEIGFAVIRATDAAFTQNVFVTTVVSTSTATTGTAYNSAQAGLTPGTLYYYKIQAVTEGYGSTGLTGSQATLDAATYYWVGATGGLWNTAANWNTAADGSGTTRTVVATTDALIVDGAGTTPGAATTISVDLASFSIGQFKVTSNTACTLESNSTTTRTITITGGPGDDFVIENGSTLNLVHAANKVAFAFSGSANTGTIAGTYNAASSTANVITTTGGTGTLVTVAPTGVINNSILGSSGCLLGSLATLAFSNGSSYTHSGFTTTNGFIPLATWGATSNVTITGGTTSTSITNAPGQTFGNFTYNSTTSTATMSAFTSNTTVIQGNLTILGTNTGKFRALTSGTLTINGNLNVSGGTFEVASTTGTLNVLGNVNVSGGTFDVAQGGASNLKVAGSFIQTAGNIIQTSATGTLEFNGTSAQTLTLIPGSHGANAINAKINNTAGVNLTSAFSIRNLTVTKGNLTGAGALTYNGTSSILTYNGTTGVQTANGIEFPVAGGPSSLTINNTSTSPDNVVTIPFSRSLAGTSGVLTLTAGILDNTGYVLSLLNTAVGGVSGGSAASYVKGVIARDLPASLLTGSTYIFPVGKSGYNPFALVNPTTNAGGTVTVQAEVFDANCNGTPGTLMGTLNTNRYWAASITNGIGNFTNSLIQLNDSIKGADAIAASTTQTGAYDNIGGTAITATATSLTTTAPEATSLPGFFVMGNKAAATLTNLAITPTGNLCTNTSRTVTVTATPGGGAVTGVVINYSIDGVAQAAIPMTNSSGNDWSGIIPTVTPANANVTWSVTATDANLLTKTAVGTPYKDEPLFGATAIASASLTTVCSGSPTNLSVVLSKNGNITFGSGTTLTGAIEQPTAFCNRWSSYRIQTVYTAAELTAAGLSAGNITAIAYNISTLGDAASNSNFTVKVGTTSLTAFTDFISNAGFTTVFPAASYTHAVGINTITFTTPYYWDGVSNLVVEVSHNGANATNNSQTYYTETTGRNTVVHSYNGSATGTLSPKRLNIIFSGNTALTPSSYSWSDGATVVGTTNPLTVNPTGNTSYTCTLIASGCSATSNTVNITTNPLPTPPTANNSSQCGLHVPGCSVTSTTANPTPTFKWYLVPTGGTPIAGITGNTYTGPAISTTTIFYVTEFDGTCESVRVPVTATVTPTDAITAHASSTSVCLDNNVELSITQTGSTQVYNFEWTASPVTGSGIPTSVSGSPVSITPTATGVYNYTVTATDGACVTASNISVTIKEKVSGVTANASQTVICNGTSIDLTSTPNTGTVTVLSENFDSPTNSWTTINNSTGGVDPALAAWTLRADGYTYSSTPYHSNDNSQFYMSNSDAQGSGGTTATILQSPAFSTIGYTSATLTFYHYYYTDENSFLEYSTDGTNWTALVTYSATVGSAAGFSLATVNLPVGAINQGTVYIRFRYNATWGYYWAIDNVRVNGSYPVYTHTWSSQPAGFTASVQNPTGVIPSDTTTYKVHVTNTVGCSDSATVTVNVNTSVGGTATATAASVCTGTGTTITLTDYDGTIQWQSSADGLTFSDISGENGVSLSTGNLTAAMYYQAVVTKLACSPANSTIATVTVDPLTDAGTVTGGAIVCSGTNSTLLTLGSHTGTIIRWESSLDGAIWTPIVNTTDTYTATNLTLTTQFRAVVKSGACSEANSGATTITVDPVSNGGTLNHDTVFCSTTNTILLSLTGNVGNVLNWESSEDGITWTPIATTSTTYTVTNLADTTKYRVLVQSGVCSPAYSTVATVTVNTAPTPTITASTNPSICAATDGNATVSTAALYTWSTIPPQYTQQATGLAAGTYFVTVSDGFCTGITSITLSDPSAPVVTLVSDYTTICSGTLVTFTAGGATDYEFFVNGVSQGAPSASTTFTSSTLANGNTVSVKGTTLGCTGNGPDVTITVDPLTIAGTVTGGATVCSGTNSTLLTLGAHTGAIVRWESSLDGTTWTPIANTNATYTATNLTATTQYRAVVQSGVCGSSNSVATTVTVDPVTVAGTVTGGTTVCSGTNSTLLTLGAHTGAILRWESSLDGTTWTPIANTNATYTATNLTATTQYRAVVQSGVCGSANSVATTVTVDPVTVAGTVTGGVNVCSGTNSTLLTLGAHIGTIVRWESSLDGTTWTPIANTNATYTASNLTATTQYRAVVQSGVCSSANSVATTVTVDPVTVAGTVTGGATVCSGTNSTLLTLGAHTGAITGWESSLDGTTWTPIANTSDTYTATNLTATTQFRAVVQSGVCSSANSVATTVTVDPVTVAGTVTGGVNVCSGTNSTLLTLGAHLGTIVRWESSLDGTTWTPIVNTTDTYTAIDLIATTQFRAVVQSGVCSSANSVATTVTVDPVTVAGTVTGGATVCSGTNSTLLTLGAHTGAITGWESSLDGTTWTPIANTSDTYTATNLTATTQFRAVVQSGVCSSANSVAETVTVDPVTVAGNVTGGATVCSGTNSTLLTLGVHTGAITGWESSLDGTTWTPIVNTSDTYTATNLTATTQFRAVVQSGVCGAANSAATTVTVDPVTVAGTVTGGATVCSGTNSTLLTLGAHTGVIVRWESSLDGTTWTPIVNITDTYTAIDLMATTQFRAVVQSGVCGSANSVATTVTVTPFPTADISYAGAPFCSTVSTPQDVTLVGTPGGNYSALPSGLTINAATGAITPSTSTAGTYTVTYTIAAAGGCSVVTATTQVTINTLLTAAISYSANPYCSSITTPQAVTLTGATGGTFTESPAGLTIDAATGAITPSTSTAGTYNVYYTLDAVGGCSVVTAITQVTINDATNLIVDLGNDTTLCINQSILLDAGNPGASYLWTPGGQITQTKLVDSTYGLGPHTFSVFVTAENTCTASDTIVVTFDDCHAGIEENNNSISVSVYPNPSNGLIYLSVSGINGTAMLNIFSMTGQIVYTEEVDNNGLINKPIDLKFYPKGMYFLRLTNDNITHTEKIIIE